MFWRAQLLGELLLDRANVKVMMRYVSDVRNLKLMMILLRTPRAPSSSRPSTCSRCGWTAP